MCKEKLFFSTAWYFSVSKCLKNVTWKIELFNSYTQVKNIWNEILIKKLFLDALRYVKFFQNFLIEIVEDIFKNNGFANV